MASTLFVTLDIGNVALVLTLNSMGCRVMTADPESPYGTAPSLVTGFAQTALRVVSRTRKAAPSLSSSENHPSSNGGNPSSNGSNLDDYADVSGPQTQAHEDAEADSGSEDVCVAANESSDDAKENQAEVVAGVEEDVAWTDIPILQQR